MATVEPRARGARDQDVCAAAIHGGVATESRAAVEPEARRQAGCKRRLLPAESDVLDADGGQSCEDGLVGEERTTGEPLERTVDPSVCEEPRNASSARPCANRGAPARPNQCCGRAR